MGKGAIKFDPKKFQQKLQSLVNERDSICSLSSLFFHNKDNAHQSVKIWMESFEKGTVDFRLSLIYLANEILHNCKRKDAPVYKEEFRKVLTIALSHLKGSEIVDKVVRVLELWSERKVMDATFCSSLIASITSSSGSIEDAKIDAELIKNFSPDTVIAALKEFLILETDAVSKERQLRILSVDALGANSAAIRALKDRAHGDAYRQQLDESCNRLEDLVRDLERLSERREALIAMLEKAHMFFAAQYSDVNVVVTAYRKYGEMVGFMRRRLEERLADSPPDPDAVAIVAASAPSPRADTADEFGVEVAVLSRREDEMEIASGGSGSGSEQHRRQGSHDRKQQRHKKQRRQRHSSGSGGGRRGDGKHSRKRSSRSRSPSSSRGSGVGGVPDRHEMAIGSDSPPPQPLMQKTQRISLHQPQHQQQPRRSGTPTLDERVVATATTTAASPSGAIGLISSPAIGAIGGWMAQLQQPWRPPQQQPSSTASAVSPNSGILPPPPPPPPRPPPPLPPPPPFFPPFGSQQQLQQQSTQQHQRPTFQPQHPQIPIASSYGGVVGVGGGLDNSPTAQMARQLPQPQQQAQAMFQFPGAIDMRDSDDRLPQPPPPLMQQQPVFQPQQQQPQQQQQQNQFRIGGLMQQQQQQPRPLFDAGSGAGGRWRPLDGGFTQHQQ